MPPRYDYRSVSFDKSRKMGEDELSLLKPNETWRELDVRLSYVLFKWVLMLGPV